MPLLKAVKGLAMCCRRAGVVGVVGCILVLIGLVHMISGVYFMLVLPMFQLGSNIWTGAWCSICGAILGVIGWKQQTMKKGQVILVASLSVLVVEVANLVIIQVGENEEFLTTDEIAEIVKANKDLTMNIAIWLTTVVTALGIVVSFFGAQYLFCVVVRGPRIKGRMPVTRSLSEEDLHHRQVHITRYRPQSLTADSRVELRELSARTSGYGSRHVHGFSDGDGVSSNSPEPLHVVVVNQENNDDSDRANIQIPQGSNNSGSSEASEPQPGPSSKRNTPKTPEDCVPYFLRNHRSAWQFIIPEVIQEMKASQRNSLTESFNDGVSRTSTLSRASKSSFQPHRPNPLLFNQRRPDILDVNHQPGGQECELPNGAWRGGPPSSCNTSLYSIPGSCARSGSKSPSGYRITRPNVPPPAPPVTKSTAVLRAAPTGGWESCKVKQYPPQAGGGFVVDLD